MKSLIETFIVMLVTGMVFGGVAAAQITSDPNAKSIELARRIIEEVWSKGNLLALEEILSNDVVTHNPGAPATKGREPFKQFVLSIRTAFPDWNETIESIIASGDMVVQRLRMEGTMTGTFRGPKRTAEPTGKRLENWGGAVFYRIAEGKIVEIWAYYDMVPWLEVLGLLPPPPQKLPK